MLNMWKLNVRWCRVSAFLRRSGSFGGLSLPFPVGAILLAARNLRNGFAHLIVVRRKQRLVKEEFHAFYSKPHAWVRLYWLPLGMMQAYMSCLRHVNERHHYVDLPLSSSTPANDGTRCNLRVIRKEYLALQLLQFNIIPSIHFSRCHLI